MSERLTKNPKSPEANFENTPADLYNVLEVIAKALLPKYQADQFLERFKNKTAEYSPSLENLEATLGIKEDFIRDFNFQKRMEVIASITEEQMRQREGFQSEIKKSSEGLTEIGKNVGLDPKDIEELSLKEKVDSIKEKFDNFLAAVESAENELDIRPKEIKGLNLKERVELITDAVEKIIYTNSYQAIIEATLEAVGLHYYELTGPQKWQIDDVLSHLVIDDD